MSGGLLDQARLRRCVHAVWTHQRPSCQAEAHWIVTTICMPNQLSSFEHTGNGLNCIDVVSCRLCMFADTFDIQKLEYWLRNPD